jgi:hypothetical protein
VAEGLIAALCGAPGAEATPDRHSVGDKSQVVYSPTVDDEAKAELVRIDATGAAHPIGRLASLQLRQRQGGFRLLPSPRHLVVLRFVGEDGKAGPLDGPLFRLAGEVTTPGSLCDVVALVAQASWTGELAVLGAETSGPAPTRSVFFERGAAIAATSNVEGERLGEVLYRYGALTLDQVRRAASAVGPELRFGEACVKLGFLSRERVYTLMAKQVEEIFYAILRVGEGFTFYFLDSFDERRLAARHNLPAQAILMEGVRRMDEMRYFREKIPSDEYVAAKTPGRPTPPDPLRPVWNAVDGKRSVVDLCREVGQGEFEVTQALFQLAQSGHVHILPPRPTGPGAVVAIFNQALAALFAELEKSGRSKEVRFQLASFATGAGVYDSVFLRAGPRDDGTFDSDRVVENIERMLGPSPDMAVVRQWLFDYVSFALFLFESQARGASAVVKRVGELVAPLAPGA